MRIIVLAWVIGTGALVAAQVEPWTNRSGLVAWLVSVSPGVDLEVLDWGGTDLRFFET
jgi:hypothetical protein